MNRSSIDAHLKSTSFQARIPEADEYAEANNLDKWSTRMLWVCLSEGTKVGRRFAMRRSNYLSSAAWNRYSALVNNGWVSQDPWGFFYDPDENPEWEEHPLMWFNHITVDITPK